MLIVDSPKHANIVMVSIQLDMQLEWWGLLYRFIVFQHLEDVESLREHISTII